MDDKDAQILQLSAKVYELIGEVERLRIANRQLADTLRARTFVPNQPIYMSGRWHRRDGNVYGTTVQPLVRSADANRPPGNLRPADQR